jgi:hypothetical protein
LCREENKEREEKMNEIELDADFSFELCLECGSKWLEDRTPILQNLSEDKKEASLQIEEDPTRKGKEKWKGKEKGKDKQGASLHIAEDAAQKGKGKGRGRPKKDKEDTKVEDSAKDKKVEGNGKDSQEVKKEKGKQEKEHDTKEEKENKKENGKNTKENKNDKKENGEDKKQKEEVTFKQVMKHMDLQRVVPHEAFETTRKKYVFFVPLPRSF